MPKGNDPLCPLGFHPQTRWPNRCKRCFRDYNDHKSVKEHSGSTTSLNSLSSYDTNTKEKEDSTPYRRTRSDLSAELISRAGSSHDGGRGDEKNTSSSSSSSYWSTTNNSNKSWSRSRPVSWSAQDLRAAVDEAKENVRSSREDLHRLYGSTKSLTAEFGSLSDLRGTTTRTTTTTTGTSTNSNNNTNSGATTTTNQEDDSTPPYTSFSSYLAMRTKSPGRPPLSRAASLPTSKSDDRGGSSGSGGGRYTEDNTDLITTTTAATTATATIAKQSPSKSESKQISTTAGNVVAVDKGGNNKTQTASPTQVSDGRPPKPPFRLRPSIKLGEIKETTQEQPKEKSKNILMLKEVKNEDESVDASYVIKLKPRKESKRVEIDLESELERLQRDLKEKTKLVEELTEKTDTLERENKELLAKKPKFGDLRKQAELSKVQQKVDELTEEVKNKNKEIKELKKEIDKRPLPKDVEKTMEDLRSKLQAAEQLCEELMDETEDYRKEIRALEEEIEEMQDNFREEQADEYRDLKRELEQTAKNCRVLQFKLKKAERRSDALERDKTEIEEKLKDLQVGEGDVDKTEKMKMLEKEVNLAKEVSVKMHEEMQKMKEQLESAERDKKKLSEKFLDKPVRPGVKLSRSQMMGRQGSQDNTDQLMRDLQGATEREQDLKDQLKYAEEETKNLRKKISRLEEENETLALQIKKMSNKAKANRQRSMERSGSTERTGSVEKGSLSRQGSTEKPPKEPDEGITEDLDPTELKIQLELNEQESAVLRRKIENLESENERLQKEIRGVLSSSRGRDNNTTTTTTTRNNNKSDVSTLEIKKLEKEIQILKTKINERESENEKLCDENKKLQLKMVKRLPLTTSETTYIDKQVNEEKIRRLEIKLKEANEKLLNYEATTTTTPTTTTTTTGRISTRRDETETGGIKKKLDDLQVKYDKLFKETEDLRNPSSLKSRTPKIPKDFTPKATLMKWVTELEEECVKLHSSLAESERRKRGMRPGSEELSTVRDFEDKLERERERNEELTRQLKEEREKLEKTLTAKKRLGSNEDDLRRYEERITSLKEQLNQEKEINQELKIRIRDDGGGGGGGGGDLKVSKNENLRLQKELKTAQETTAVLEKKLKETEENLKATERNERRSKAALERIEAKLEEERSKGTVTEERQKELTVSWLKERDDLKKELTEAKKAKEKAERDMKTAKKAYEGMESKFEEEKRKAEEAHTNKRKDIDDLKTLRRAKEELEIELVDLRESVSQVERNKERLEQKYKRELENLRKENDNLSIKMNGLDSELKSEKRRRERLEKDSNTFRANVKTEEDLKKVKEEFETLQKEHKELEKTRKKEKQMLDSLQSKYDLLEEDFVVQKAQFTTSKEGVDEKYEKLKKEHTTIETELKTLRETYNSRQDTWIKEKLNMQEQLRDLEARLKKVSNDPTSYSEKKRLKDIIDDKNHQIDQLKRDADTLKDQVSYYRRESEDLRRKVDDLEKLQQINDKRASDIAFDASTYDTTIRELRDKITSTEKIHKTDLTKIKMKYDSKLKAMAEEVSTLTQHMTKYRRERDTYKEMLDGSQRTIAELKGSGNYKTSRADNASEATQHLLETQELHAQVTELEDKLADARLDNTKLKNELIDQKTNFEIQLCDLQTKVNEYDEGRLLVGNARRLPGLRTRLELNWQKEREEQQRLIQETATLAKDLRQTLYEVERERDLEKLEAKRKIDQLKKTVGQETSDTKTKVQELQRDLQELREAHAKLRQINEKLRREKDRTEVEREAMRDKYLGSSREHLNQQSRMERLIEEMKIVKDLAPLVLGEGIDDRESSLTKLSGEIKPKTREEFTESLKKACKSMEELKRIMGLADDRDRFKRAPSFRRALSDMESEDESVSGRHRSYRGGGGSGGSGGGVHRSAKGQRSMYRKTQSLDHQLAEERNKIWVSTDAGSTTSIDSTMTDDIRRAKYDRDLSMDRMSTGSQTSELDAIGEKKKKGVKAIFSRLTKSRSIEDSSTGGSIVGAGVKAMGVGMGGSGSDISTAEGEKESKVKGKLKSLFKSGPPTRSQSVERERSKEVASSKTAVGEESKTGSVASLESEAGGMTLTPAVTQRSHIRGRHSSNNGGGTISKKTKSVSSLTSRGSVETEV